MAEKKKNDSSKEEYRNWLCAELKKEEYKEYITNDVIKLVCDAQEFYGKSATEGKLRNPKLWEDVLKTESWTIQRYKDDNRCRILDCLGNLKGYGTVRQVLCPILEHCRRKMQLKKVNNKDWGIVFCGGGGKGAYQIGVWKWLIEQGFSEKITGIVGASVGALNSLLFVNGDFEKACAVWDKIVSNDIIEKKFGMISLFQSQKPLEQIFEDNMTDEEWGRVCQTDKMVYSSLTGIKPFAIIPSDAVMEYLEHGMTIKSNDIRNECYCWASRSKEEITEIVLASAAIPVLKKDREFEGRRVVDGGLSDNVPVLPLVKDGFRNIIVVHLSRRDESGEENLAFKKAIQNLNVNDVNFYHVYPSKTLGDMRMAFSVLTDGRMNLGYHDAKKQLKDILIK